MGYYMYFTFTLFPITAVLLSLLMLPTWGRVRSGVLTFVDSVLMMRFKGAGIDVSLFTILSIVAGTTFLASSADMMKAHATFDASRGTIRSEYIVTNKFKTERNWWISLFALALWLTLFRVREYIRYIAKLEDRLAVGGSEAQHSAPVRTRQDAGLNGNATTDSIGSKKNVASANITTPTAPIADLPPTSAVSKKEL